MYIRCNTLPMKEEQWSKNSKPYDKRISNTVRFEIMTVWGT